MALSPKEWLGRFYVQAAWSRALRSYFFESQNISSSDQILDIGCGPGALLSDLQTIAPGQIYGADINLEFLSIAAPSHQETHFSGADVHRLPFPDACFDLVICHYFLMWTGDPSSAIREMKRVTRPGGIVAAFAEPDYGGRIDFPTEFIQLKELQINALIQAGADPMMGRRLKSLFTSEDLSLVEWGVFQGSWKEEPSPEEINSEWMVLRDDLKDQLKKSEIDALEKHDRKARASGSRLVYVPTFYCWGKTK